MCQRLVLLTSYSRTMTWAPRLSFSLLGAWPPHLLCQGVQATGCHASLASSKLRGAGEAVRRVRARSSLVHRTYLAKICYYSVHKVKTGPPWGICPSPQLPQPHLHYWPRHCSYPGRTSRLPSASPCRLCCCHNPPGATLPPVQIIKPPSRVDVRVK